MSNYEGFPLPIILVGIEGEIIFANPNAQDLFGVSLKTMQKNTIFDLVRPHSKIRGIFDRIRQSGIDTFFGEISFISPNLNEVISELIVARRDDPKELLMVFWPRSNAAEVIARRNEKDKDRSIGQIGRALAHEVKNPLLGIRGAAQLLMLDAKPSQKPLAKLIIDETDRVHRLIDRVESLGLDEPISTQPLNIHLILDRVVQLAKNGFAANLNIAREYDVSLPNVKGEADRLTQIFLNLAKNAAEAANEKGSAGRIIFSTRYRHGHKYIDENNQTFSLPIEVSVTDNGFGINNELKDIVFDPFVTTKAEGSGLGLALVRKMVVALGGIIEVSSEPGKTSFKVRLPVVEDFNPKESQNDWIE